MADLEKLALKRDRGYLVRLVLVLALGTGAGAFVFAGLTGETFAGCVANVFVGAPRRGEGPPGRTEGSADQAPGTGLETSPK